MAFTNLENKKTTFTRLLWVLVYMFSIQLTFSKNIYVNDNSITRDIYTTAIGNNANSGLTPALPKLTLAIALGRAVAGSVVRPGSTEHATDTSDLRASRRTCDVRVNERCKRHTDTTLHLTLAWTPRTCSCTRQR